MRSLRLLPLLLATVLLVGCQITAPGAAPGAMPGPGSIAYEPGARPPPPGEWTTPVNAEAGRLESGATVRILGLTLEVPASVIAMTEASADDRVGDALERRTRVSSLYGGPPEFIVTYRSVYQFGTNLHDADGDSPDLWTNLFRVSYEQPLPVFGRLGIYGSYTNRDYEFEGPNPFIAGTDDPWGSVHQLAVGANLFQPVHERFAVFIATDFRWHVEDGQSFSKGASWAVTLGGGYRVSEKLDLGAGIIVQDTFGDEVFILGGPQFDWRPNRTWRFVLSGTELDIQCNINRNWQLGAGGGFIGHRFRLDDEGPGANYIAAESRFPIYVQARYRGIDDLDMTLRVGTDITREFRIQDSGGNTLRTYESDPSPFVSFRAILRF